MPHFLAIAPPEYLLALGFLSGVIATCFVAVFATCRAMRDEGRA